LNGNRPLAALLQHADFLDQMHKVLDLRNRWAVLAGEPLSEQTAIRQDIVPRRHQTNRRP